MEEELAADLTKVDLGRAVEMPSAQKCGGKAGFLAAAAAAAVNVAANAARLSSSQNGGLEMADDGRGVLDQHIPELCVGVERCVRGFFRGVYPA